MRSVLLGAVCGVAFATSANAADLGAPAYGGGYGPLWTGFYAGVNGGYAWGDWKGNFTYQGATDPGFNPAKVNADGGFGGGQIGYNFQGVIAPRIVVGLEADIEGADLNGKGSFNYKSTFGTPPAPIFTKDTSFSLDYFGTVRGRIGYSFGQFLPYFTGGLAYGHANSNVTVHNNYLNAGGFLVGPSATGSVSEDHVGWTIGGGFEYALSRSWSVKAEYLYIDLGSEGYHWTGSCAASVGCPGNVFNTDGLKSDLTFSTVKAGINYHVGAGYEPLK